MQYSVLIQLWGLGERRELSQWVPGQSPPKTVLIATDRLC